MIFQQVRTAGLLALVFLSGVGCRSRVTLPTSLTDAVYAQDGVNKVMRVEGFGVNARIHERLKPNDILRWKSPAASGKFYVAFDPNFDPCGLPADPHIYTSKTKGSWEVVDCQMKRQPTGPWLYEVGAGFHPVPTPHKADTVTAYQIHSCGGCVIGPAEDDN